MPGEHGLTRSFLALLLPDAIVAEAARLSERMRREAPTGIRWVPRENFHLTVRFFGDLDAASVSRASQLVASLDHRFEPVPARLGAVSAFPSRNRPQVIWVGIDAEQGALDRRVRAIEEQLMAAGFGASDKPWKSHLTLGRVNRDAQLPAPVAARLFGGAPGDASGSIDTLILFESKLSSRGASYSPLAVAHAGRGSLG